MKTSTNNEYFDLELDVNELCKNNIDDYFSLQDIKNRKIYINDDICQFSVADAVKFIMQYNKEDAGIDPSERRPIYIYVVSNGGEIDSGFELIDTICNSVTPVYTINLGYQYSMGFLIGLAGHKRFAMPNAKFLMHDGSRFLYDSSAKAHDFMEFNTRLSNRIKNYVVSHSKLTEDEYDSKFRVEWYLFADEAKEKGFTDYIIGEDCDIYEII